MSDLFEFMTTFKSIECDDLITLFEYDESYGELNDLFDSGMTYHTYVCDNGLTGDKNKNYSDVYVVLKKDVEKSLLLHQVKDITIGKLYPFVLKTTMGQGVPKASFIDRDFAVYAFNQSIIPIMEKTLDNYTFLDSIEKVINKAKTIRTTLELGEWYSFIIDFKMKPTWIYKLDGDDWTFQMHVENIASSNDHMIVYCDLEKYVDPTGKSHFQDYWFYE